MKYLELKKTSLYFESELELCLPEWDEYLHGVLSSIKEECYFRNLPGELEVFNVILCNNFSNAEKADLNNALVDALDIDEITVREKKLPENEDFDFGIKDIVVRTKVDNIKIILNVIFMDKYENKN